MPHNAPLFRSFTSAFRSFSLLPGEFYVKRDIPLGLLAAQQRDVNYSRSLLAVFFFSFLSSLSLSVCLSLSLLCSHWLRNMCVNRNFFTECIVHLHFCARARDPWPNWHCSVTCCGISCRIRVWQRSLWLHFNLKFAEILADIWPMWTTMNITQQYKRLVCIGNEKIWNFHSWKYIFPVCFIFPIEF